MKFFGDIEQNNKFMEKKETKKLNNTKEIHVISCFCKDGSFQIIVFRFH